MDSFEWNKIFGALLGTAFVVLGLNFLAEGIYSSHAPEKAGFAIEGGEVETAAAGGGKEVAALEPVAPLLASADLGAGEKVAKKCTACHTFDKGGANKVGPALYGIVERPIAGHEGFGYSTAMKTYGEGKTWTYEELNGFLAKPKGYIKGTAMGFAGLKKPDERAAIIAFMRAQADSPAPLPDPAATPAATDAPKEGEEPKAGEAPKAEETKSEEQPTADESKTEEQPADAEPKTEEQSN